VRIGITTYGQLGLGALEDFGLPQPGTIMTKGQSFGCFFVGDDTMIFDFPGPVNGQIIEVNQDIENDPSLINMSPYDAGWLVVVKLDNPEDLNDLLTYEEYFSTSCPPCHCNV
jgi:glycine cleavage system H protein